MCVGQRFAMLTIKYSMAELVRNYQFVQTENTPLECPQEPGSIIMLAKNVCKVKVIKRQPFNNYVSGYFMS